MGLTGEGIHFGAADLIVGTSAGSVVGAQLALAMDLSDGIAQMAGAPLPVVEGAAGMEGLMVAMAEAATSGATPEEGRIVLGRVATEAKTVTEDAFLGVFDLVKGRAWPETFACTAVDVASGEFQVWNASSGVELRRALASSCSIQASFPRSPSTGSATWTAGCARPSTPTPPSATTS